jgi:serine/threonine protein kinase HipA of HipAB toxin-antitoxin module
VKADDLLQKLEVRSSDRRPTEPLGHQTTRARELLTRLSVGEQPEHCVSECPWIVATHDERAGRITMHQVGQRAVVGNYQGHACRERFGRRNTEPLESRRDDLKCRTGE